MHPLNCPFFSKVTKDAPFCFIINGTSIFSFMGSYADFMLNLDNERIKFE